MESYLSIIGAVVAGVIGTFHQTTFKHFGNLKFVCFSSDRHIIKRPQGLQN